MAEFRKGEDMNRLHFRNIISCMGRKYDVLKKMVRVVIIKKVEAIL